MVKRIFIDGIKTANMIDDDNTRRIIQTFFYNSFRNNNVIYDTLDNSIKEIEAIVELVNEDYSLTAFCRDKGTQYLNTISYDDTDKCLKLSTRHVSNIVLDKLSIESIKQYNESVSCIGSRIRSVIFTTEEVWIFE